MLNEYRLDKGHCTALPNCSGIYEHLDSDGAKPDETLEWADVKMRRNVTEATPYPTKLINGKP